MARRTSLSPLILTFFGLTQEYRQNLFSQIHEIVFHGNGGFDWHTVYNMPIWLRNFTFKKLQDHHQKEKEAIDKSQNKLQNKSSKDILRPGVDTSGAYNTAMPTKK